MTRFASLCACSASRIGFTTLAISSTALATRSGLPADVDLDAVVPFLEVGDVRPAPPGDRGRGRPELELLGDLPGFELDLAVDDALEHVPRALTRRRP